MIEEDVKTEAALLLKAWKTHDEKYKEDSPLPTSLLGRTYKLLESLQSLQIAERTALKELLQYANTWASDREHPEMQDSDGIHISEWGLGYKQACRDFYRKIDTQKKSKTP